MAKRKGMFTSVELDKADVKRIEAELKQFNPDRMTKVLRTSTRAGASRLAARMRKLAPVGPTGNLRASIGTARVRRRGGTAAVAAPLQKAGRRMADGTVKGARKGYHRHLVVRGTKPHWIKVSWAHALDLPFGPRDAVHHPGSKPNPFVAAAYDKGIVMEAMVKSIQRQLKKARK